MYIYMHIYRGRIQGGGGAGGPPPPPLSERLGIDFYSGFRKKIQAYTFIVASEKKTQGGEKHKGGGGEVQLEILKNPGMGVCVGGGGF